MEVDLQVRRLETRLYPRAKRRNIRPAQTEQKRHRAPVQISRLGRLGRVDVGVRVDPDQARAGVVSLDASVRGEALCVRTRSHAYSPTRR